VGLGFLASTRAKLNLTGEAAQPGFSGRDEYDSTLDHEVVAELQSRRYPLLGLTVLPDDALRFGLVYRGESQIVLDVDSGFDGVVGLGPVEFPVHYLLESTTVVSFQPRQVALGVSYRDLTNAHLNLDLQWTQWSAYTSPLAATQSELDLDTQGLVAAPELPEPRALESAHLADRVVPRFGVEYEWFAGGPVRLPVRAGYAFVATPLQSSSTRNLVDADRHVLCLGAGIAGRGPEPLLGTLSLDVHAAWSVLLPRVGTGPDGEPHRASGDILVLGATLGVGL
jgi:long-subunit fatty acid transport protein